MIKRIFKSTALLSIILSSNAYAESDKNLSIGLASYNLTITYADISLTDDEFSGTAISALYATSNNVAFGAILYSLEYDLSASLTNDGYEFNAYYGTGFTKTGFKAYIGGGLFSESWEATGASESFAGLQLSGGIGYNWDVFSLDLMLAVRDSSDYDALLQDSLGLSLDPTAISSALILSARF